MKEEYRELFLGLYIKGKSRKPFSVIGKIGPNLCNELFLHYKLCVPFLETHYVCGYLVMLIPGQ